MVIVASRQPRKQRKALYNAPVHARSKLICAPLSEELREKYGIRAVRVVTGDTVRLTRGDFAGDEGVVDIVNSKKRKIVVHGVFVTKSDGTEVPRPVDPSNVVVTKLNLKDQKREEMLEAKK